MSLQPTWEVLEQPRAEREVLDQPCPAGRDPLMLRTEKRARSASRVAGVSPPLAGPPRVSGPRLHFVAFLSSGVLTPASAAAPMSPGPQNAWTPLPAARGPRSAVGQTGREASTAGPGVCARRASGGVAVEAVSFQKERLLRARARWERPWRRTWHGVPQGLKWSE